MNRLSSRTVLLLAIAAAAAPLVAATPSEYRLKHSSWGKPGVSFDDYRADGIACATGAYRTDLADTAPGKAMVAASRMVGTRTDQESYQTANQMIGGVDRQLAAASDIQYGELGRCLVARGYRRFDLTASQSRHLAKLPAGSDARHHYLYELASDPDVLAHQAADDVGG